ncbi:MAG: glycosyltransferase family 2 protein [Clostridia bacterium]
MDEDVRLLPFALYEIERFLEYNECHLIYADNDFLEESKRINPELKPHFAYDTLLSKNYFGNFIVVKTKFLQVHEEILKGLSQTETIYHLILRILSKTERIMHIDTVLYHKVHENINETEQMHIIEEYLNREKIAYQSVEKGKFEGQYKINYTITQNPKISIVIPNMDHIEDLDKAIQSILTSTYTNYEVVIVENNSKQPETFAYYERIQKQDSRIRVVTLKIEQFNYSKIMNFGVSQATGEYMVLLNNDIEVLTKDWLEQMLMYVQRENVGICGVKLYFPDRSIQHAGVTIGVRGLAGHKYREVKEEDFSKTDGINYVQDLSAVTAACLMVKKQTYETLLGFDEKLAVAFNDVDFCLKVRKAKLYIVYNPFVELYHYESKSRGGEDTKEKQRRFAKEYELFVKRWRRTIQKGDPYFNINYRLDTDIPTINYNKIR